MPFPEHVTPGWSVTYPSSGVARANTVAKRPGRLPVKRIYPSWCLVYPPQTSTPGARSSDPAEHLLGQVVG